MRVLAIDPGNERTAFVLFESGRVLQKGIWPNYDVLSLLGDFTSATLPDECVVEMIASYGMPVGAEVFETCVWIGRFVERWESVSAGAQAHQVVRRDVKMHLCGNNAAKDGNIRAALIDRFGPGKAKAIGTKNAQGPLYGVRADEWAALALAVTFADTRGKAAA